MVLMVVTAAAECSSPASNVSTGLADPQILDLPFPAVTTPMLSLWAETGSD